MQCNTYLIEKSENDIILPQKACMSFMQMSCLNVKITLFKNTCQHQFSVLSTVITWRPMRALNGEHGTYTFSNVILFYVIHRLSEMLKHIFTGAQFTVDMFVVIFLFSHTFQYSELQIDYKHPRLCLQEKHNNSNTIKRYQPFALGSWNVMRRKHEAVVILCWSTVCDAHPTLSHHRYNVLCGRLRAFR